MRITSILTIIAFFFTLTSAAAQRKMTTIMEAIGQNEGERVTIEMDLTTIMAQRNNDTYFPAAVMTDNGLTFKAEVRPRGKYRRKNAVYPPLKLKFKKKELIAAGMDTLNEIKLVLPAFDNALGDELVIREYLAYKMFEKLSPVHVKARLIRLTIKDTHVEKSKKTMFAILVEDAEETAARYNGVEVEEYGISPDSLAANQAALMVMFEYMIGNTDWDISMMRNVRLIRTQAGGKVLALPYDFDFSGLVSAPYASPSSDTGLRTVRDRFLMANGIKPDALKRAVMNLRKNRQAIYDICRNRFASRDTSDDMMLFLDTFFNQIGEKDEVPQMLKMDDAD
ncbi:MAG: hypothetical protein RL013_35 [Bacteroidota bacterium]|jgi:hypothetical protein